MTQLERFRRELQATGADCALISSQLNIRYLCGFDYTDGYLLIFSGAAYLLTDFRYAEAARAQVKDFEIVLPETDMLSEIKLLLSINGASTLAIEDEHVTCAFFSRLQQKLEGVTIATGASDVLRALREVKLEYELALIARAQSITDAAFDHILGFISPERTEKEVALELEFFMRRMGADATAFDTIAVSGASSSLPHGVPSDRPLSRGFLTMDFGAKYGGYCSDMTRTVVIGKADSDMKRIYDTVLTAQLAALETIHEGMECKVADKIARDIIAEAGYGKCFGHSLGHGVGLYIHESPSLSRRAGNDSVLKRGNVVTVEPGIYIEGKYGCRIEDMIAIGHDGGVINYTKSTKKLIEL